MSDSPYVQFYTSDFLGGTGGMSAATKGVYITLMCLIYESEEPLPQGWSSLARRCGTSNSGFKRAIDELVDDGKVELLDDGIWIPKCEKHIDLRRKKAAIGLKAAKKRWEKPKQNQRPDDADAMQTQCQPEPEPEPLVKETPNGVSKNRRGSRLPDDWVLPDDWRDWAVSHGWSETVIRLEAEKFGDHWRSAPGQRGVKLDWKATWRNWMRNASPPRVVSQQTDLDQIFANLEAKK